MRCTLCELNFAKRTQSVVMKQTNKNNAVVQHELSLAHAHIGTVLLKCIILSIIQSVCYIEFATVTAGAVVVVATRRTTLFILQFSLFSLAFFLLQKNTRRIERMLVERPKLNAIVRVFVCEQIYLYRERDREKKLQKKDQNRLHNTHYLYAHANKSDSIAVAIHIFVVVVFYFSLLLCLIYALVEEKVSRNRSHRVAR